MNWVLLAYSLSFPWMKRNKNQGHKNALHIRRSRPHSLWPLHSLLFECNFQNPHIQLFEYCICTLYQSCTLLSGNTIFYIDNLLQRDLINLNFFLDLSLIRQLLFRIIKAFTFISVVNSSKGIGFYAISNHHSINAKDWAINIKLPSF